MFWLLCPDLKYILCPFSNDNTTSNVPVLNPLSEIKLPVILVLLRKSFRYKVLPSADMTTAAKWYNPANGAVKTPLLVSYPSPLLVHTLSNLTTSFTDKDCWDDLYAAKAGKSFLLGTWWWSELPTIKDFFGNFWNMKFDRFTKWKIYLLKF